MLHQAPTPQAEGSDALDAQPQRMSAPVTTPPTVAPEWRVGRKLMEARQQRGWTLDEVAERIRVRREFLDALEQTNFKLLPGKAYALAFLRSYARELGLDEKAIVDQFQDECAPTRGEGPKKRAAALKPRKDRPWTIAAGLVVIAASFVGWRALEVSSVRSPSAGGMVAASPVLAEAAVSGSPLPVAPAHVVEIRALSEAWLEARGPDGTVFLSRTLRPGDVYRPDPSPGWTLHARDGGAFELFVNGMSAGLLGTPGMPVLGRQIDEIQPLVQADAGRPRS